MNEISLDRVEKKVDVKKRVSEIGAFWRVCECVEMMENTQHDNSFERFA